MKHLHLKGNASPVRRVYIPKPGTTEQRPLGIPAVYDGVCQQALRNRLEPIFEPVLDDSRVGYRPGRSAKDALRKVWREIEAGAEWIVDGDLKDYETTRPDDRQDAGLVVSHRPPIGGRVGDLERPRGDGQTPGPQGGRQGDGTAARETVSVRRGLVVGVVDLTLTR